MGYIPLTDERILLIACKAGDIKSYEQLIRMHLDLINNTAYSITGDEEKAKKIAVLVCAHLWKVRDRIPLYGSLKVYFCNYVHAVIKASLRKAG